MLGSTLTLMLAFYRPYPLEDTPEWSSDPIVWESGRDLPCEITTRHADGTADVIVTGADGRKHVRLRQRVATEFDKAFSDAGSWIILREMNDEAHN